MTPLTVTELLAAALKLHQRETALRDRGWMRPPTYDRHDVKANFRINRWQMQQGTEPEET